MLSNDASEWDGFPNVDNSSVGTEDFHLAGGGVGGIKEGVEDFDDFLVAGDGVRGGGVKEGGGDWIGAGDLEVEGTDFEDLELLFGTGLAFAKNFFPLAPIMVFAQGFSIN